MPEDPAPPVDTAMDQRRPSTPGEDHPEPPPFTLEGKRVFVAHVDRAWAACSAGRSATPDATGAACAMARRR